MANANLMLKIQTGPKSEIKCNMHLKILTNKINVAESGMK